MPAVDPALVSALVSELRRLHDELRSWRGVAKLYPPAVKPGTLCRIAKGGYLPDDKRILRALGLIEKRKRTEMEKRIDGMARETRKALVIK